MNIVANYYLGTHHFMITSQLTYDTTSVYGGFRNENKIHKYISTKRNYHICFYSHSLKVFHCFENALLE